MEIAKKDRSAAQNLGWREGGRCNGSSFLNIGVISAIISVILARLEIC